MEKKRLTRLLFAIVAGPIGGAFFWLTKGIFKNRKRTKIGRVWWYGYIYYYAHHYDIEKLKKNNKGYRVIKRIMPNFDFFRAYNTVFQLDCMCHILYEMSQGYIPIIDDTYGVWNQFFEQPVLPIEEGKTVDDYPVSDVDFTMIVPCGVEPKRGFRIAWSKVIRDFCRLKGEAKTYIENEVEEVLSKGNRVLGVVCRGTDYIGTGMPKQPPVEMLAKDIKEWMEKYNYDKIYFATEDERIFEKMIKIFPDQILVNKRTYYDQILKDTNQKWIGAVNFERENDNFYRGLEYYSSINILANCDALLAGFCGASGMAWFLNAEQYEHCHIYWLGHSTEEDLEKEEQ